MKLYLSLVLLLAFALVLGGCTQPPAAPVAKGPTQAEDVAALKTHTAQYEAAYASSDATALAALFADDGIRMSPDRPAVAGRAALLADYQNDFAMMSKTYASQTFGLTIDDVEVTGDWAYVRGGFTWTGTLKAVGAKPIDAPGKWLGVYKRETGGAWKYHRACWNSNQPPVPVK